VVAPKSIIVAAFWWHAYTPQVLFCLWFLPRLLRYIGARVL